METQLRFVSKEEAHKLIDEMPGKKVLVLTYEESVGISDYGEYIKKSKGKRLVDNANVLVLKSSAPILTLNLHDKFFNDLVNYNREPIVRSILLTQKG